MMQFDANSLILFIAKTEQLISVTNLQIDMNMHIYNFIILLSLKTDFLASLSLSL